MPKKLFTAAGLLIALVLFSSASSSWEGASTPDFYGALPERGFYVATNSFPRNTVVDIVNLETGKTIQAIVVDNPSSISENAVILSRDAAEAIGMGTRSSVRIRISPPADSVAFSPFSDGRSFSGDPDYDPKAFVRAYALPVETDAVAPPPTTKEESSVPPPVKIIPDPVKDTGPVQIKKEESPSAPPSVKIIPDPVKNTGPVQIAPLPAEPEIVQADEVPVTSYPLLSPSEPMPFFMPPPLPNAVFIEDESPPSSPAQEAPAEQEITQFELPSIVPGPLLPPETAASFIPMPLPEISAYEFIGEDTPVEAAVEPSVIEDSEAPEISEAPRPWSSNDRTSPLPSPASPGYADVSELEPENPFPDVSLSYQNPVDYPLPVIALDEPPSGNVYDITAPGESAARDEENEELPPELSLPGQMPNERGSSLAEASGENIFSKTGEDDITGEESPPEIIPPGQMPYESDAEILADVGESIERINDTPDITSIDLNPTDEYEDEKFLDEVSAGKLHDLAASGEPVEDSENEESPPELSLPNQTTYENDDAVNLTEADAEIIDTPDVITYRNPSEGYIPSGRSLDEAVISESYETTKEETIYNSEDFPETSLVYAEPGMSGRLELSDGLWMLKNPAGLEYVLGRALPAEDVYPGFLP
ncbi:MAG: hypothetical protein LBH18_01625, partial [Spirochaetaceae bacterium]|nr:hypothetical protein [Spirochaetaceae bacterium]